MHANVLLSHDIFSLEKNPTIRGVVVVVVLFAVVVCESVNVETEMPDFSWFAPVTSPLGGV